MRKPTEKWFVTFFDCDNRRGLVELKAKSKDAVEKEVQMLLDTGAVTDPVVMNYDQLACFYREIGDALGYFATVNWMAEDVMEMKKCRRAKAEDFLSNNEEHIRDRTTEMGWDVIATLWDCRW